MIPAPVRTVCTADQMRAAEQVFLDSHPGVDLMQAAADALTDAAVRMLLGDELLEESAEWLAQQRVLVLAGPGNNGGDGLFAAARLSEAGWLVDVCQVLGTAHQQGRRAAQTAGCGEVDLDQIADRHYDLALDAVLGIGGRPGIPESLIQLDAALREAGTPVLAVDLPSGLSADSGEVTTAMHATTTVTFASAKWCHVAHPAVTRCGQVIVADIGVAVDGADQIDDVADLARRWPVPGPRSSKYSRGVVGLDTGSQQYPGAGVLGVLGALRSGAGMVRCVGPENVRAHAVNRAPSVVCAEGRVQAWVVGSGWGPAEDNSARLDRRLADGLPTVVDADALAVLPRRIPENCLLTPHAGELAGMLGVERTEVEADPRGHALAAARMFGATVLVKGSIQWVAGPDGQVSAALPGPGWTGQAGSGDTLAGICGTLLAAGLSAREAALTGAGIQALAASRHPGPYSPDQLADLLPQVIGDLV